MNLYFLEAARLNCNDVVMSSLRYFRLVFQIQKFLFPTLKPNQQPQPVFAECHNLHQHHSCLHHCQREVYHFQSHFHLLLQNHLYLLDNEIIPHFLSMPGHNYHSRSLHIHYYPSVCLTRSIIKLFLHKYESYYSDYHI